MARLLKTTQFFAIILIFQITILKLSVASEHGHGDAHNSIPFATIKWQIINLSVLVFALVYLLRKPVKDFFIARQAEFVEAAKKSESAKIEAEKQYLDIFHKIKELEVTKEDSIARAKKEASILRAQLIDEANQTATRMSHEAKSTIDLELQKAQHNLKEALLSDSLKAARTTLTKNIGSSEHQKLQADFVNNVEVVL